MQLAAESIEHRGQHATGFGWQRADGATMYWKHPGKATQVARKAGMKGNITSAIGHTRFATQGKPEITGPASNNHPLVEPGIVLVHNGVVSNDADIFDKMPKEWKRVNEVDSQAIACLLAYPEVFGYDDGVSALEGELVADYALAWLRVDDPGALHLAVGAGRPMHIGQTRRGDLVMASEDRCLDDIERWSGLAIGHRSKVPDGTYMRVFDGDITELRSFTPKEREKPPVTSYSGYSSYSRPGYHRRNGQTVYIGGRDKKDDDKSTIQKGTRPAGVPDGPRDYDPVKKVWVCKDGTEWAWTADGWTDVTQYEPEPSGKLYIAGRDGEVNEIVDKPIAETTIRPRYWHLDCEEWTHAEWLDNIEYEWQVDVEDYTSDELGRFNLDQMLTAYKEWRIRDQQKQREEDLWEQEIAETERKRSKPFDQDEEDQLGEGLPDGLPARTP